MEPLLLARARDDAPVNSRLVQQSLEVVMGSLLDGAGPGRRVPAPWRLRRTSARLPPR